MQRRRRLNACLIAALLVLPALALASPPAEAPPDDFIDWAAAQRFWSFRPPKAPPRPVIKNRRWVNQPLDAFVLARLERQGASPAPEAARRTLIRRVTFDLTGLPPTPEEVAAFEKDRAPDAWRKVVDRLLASPRYGERMASIWLPLARYAEDQAHQVGSDTKFFYPNAHKYRDWVIAAFNRDLPYDRFIQLQLAADKLPPAPGQTPAQAAGADLAALGFLGLGPKYYNRNRLAVQADEWEDRVDTVTRSFLGLTVACARCHHHKFDPITQQDYTALAGVFASTKMVNRRHDGQPEKDDVKAEEMAPGTMHVVEEGTAADLNLFWRGDPENKGPVVKRRFLRVLSRTEPPPFQEGSGRRELAEAIANRDNPLTARVMVNRLWGLIFGKPLVATPSNFGHTGMRPTHPELLDDLAVRFMKRGWSVKAMVREMVLSSTYRQASDCGLRIADCGLSGRQAAPERASSALRRGWSEPGNPQSAIGNPQFTGAPRRRLTVEQWRDALLFVTGELSDTGANSPDLDDPENRRRTVYARVSRLKLNAVLAQFDYPDANVHAEQRSVTTTPTQKLFMLNSPFILARAKALAARLAAEPGEDDRARIQRAYRLLFSRDPHSEEMRLALAFLAKPTPEGAQGPTRWEQYTQALLASNELLYVD